MWVRCKVIFSIHGTTGHPSPASVEPAASSGSAEEELLIVCCFISRIFLEGINEQTINYGLNTTALVPEFRVWLFYGFGGVYFSSKASYLFALVASFKTSSTKVEIGRHSFYL